MGKSIDAEIQFLGKINKNRNSYGGIIYGRLAI